ncbi:hypothetical protein PHYPSEUDO_012088 [Phytophthora pseudosyringae]|uniref:Nuclear fragile X mental retardation-interacting protein 1 n=1 Tax=Phytophthora pseudosyringae TaxID=221518 RepID=A0A8T1W4V5_9STRA|nr:hypothetical protein PHYPSEUDO_012088 [Phytophthora pseudosyringae]
MDRGGSNLRGGRGGRGFGRGRGGGRGRGRGRGRGGGGGRGSRGSFGFRHDRHDDQQGYDQGYAPPPQTYPPQYPAPPQTYPSQQPPPQYSPPQEQYQQPYQPPRDQYQQPFQPQEQQWQQPSPLPQQFQQFPPPPPPMDRFQPMDTFQQPPPPQQYQNQPFQPQDQPWQQPPPQFQQFQDESPRYSSHPPMPPMPAPPTDYADATRTRQRAYAPVPPEDDAPDARPPSYQETNQQQQQQPPLPHRDPRGDWQQPPPQYQNQQFQPQDQQWQQPPPQEQQQFGGPPGYAPQGPGPNARPPMDQRHHQRDQNPRFHDRHQDRQDRHHQKPHRPPPPSYVCHNCNQPGHWKQHCPLFANENDRYGSRQEDPFQRRYGPGPGPGPDRQWAPAPPLPAAKPQDPRRNGASYNNVASEDSDFPMTSDPSGGLPPLPDGPAPPLPPNAQPPLPYDDNGYGQQQQQQQQPGQQVWKCETCVKSFVIASQYEAHVSTHVTCSDCDFSASKRVVTAHYQTAHGQYAGQGLKEIDVEGQKFMVLVGNSAEDITKWREDRRKRWLAMSRQPKPAPTAPVPAPVAGKRKLSASSEEDLEEGEIEEDEEAKAQVVLRNALAAPDSGSQEPPAKKQRKTMLCKWFSRGHCRFDEAHCKYSHDRSAFGCRAMLFKGSCSKGLYCPFSHDTAVLSGQRERSQKASKERTTEQQWRGEQKSLLRKLLAKDVRVEQSKMLQIVHFLVVNEFLRSSDGEKADVSAKEPAVKIEMLKSEEASSDAIAEASEPIKSESEDTVMEEASGDVKPEQESTEECNSTAPSQAAEPTKVVVDENVLPVVEATACEQESQGVSKSPEAEKSDAVASSLDGVDVKTEAAREGGTVKDASSSADAEPANPEEVAAAVPSKDVEPVEAASDCGEVPGEEVRTGGQADTFETSVSEANEAC